MTDQPTGNSAPDPASSNGGDPTAQPAQPFELKLPDDSRSQGDWYLWAGVLALVALVAFWPVIQGNFIWDDEAYVTQNLLLRDFAGLKNIWIPPAEHSYDSSTQTIQYYPLLYSMLWFEHHLWGRDSAMGYHIVNLLLHAGSAVLLWRILRRLRLPGAWVAAAVWAVHPLQAESVCWISEGKNILSGILAFASILFFLQFCEFDDPAGKSMKWINDRWQAYAFCFVLFVAALLAKTVVIAVVPALFVILWWKRRLNVERVLTLIPLGLIAMWMSSITARREIDPLGPIQATGPAWHLSLAQHILLPARDFWFYLGKLFVPIGLSFNYPRIAPDGSNPAAWIMLGGAIALLVILLALSRKIGRGPVVAILCYIFALLPSMGFVNVFPFRYSYVADHFQYLAGVSIVVMVVSTIARLLPSREKVDPTDVRVATLWPAAIAVALVLVLGISSWVRADVFQDSYSLWNDALAKNPQSWQAAYLLGRAEIGKSDAFIAQATEYHMAGQKDAETDEFNSAQDALSSAEHHLQMAADNPQSPQDVVWQCYNELCTTQLKRRAWPDANLPDLIVRAQGYIDRAIAGEQVNEASHPDATPYLNKGNLLVLRADAAMKHLIAASTQDSPTTQSSSVVTATTQTTTTPTTRLASTEPSTRPATPEEANVKQLYLNAFDEYGQATRVASAGLKDPVLARAALQTIGLCYTALGKVGINLAQIANMRSDVTDEHHYLNESGNAFHNALLVDPKNPDLHHNLARCLEGLDLYAQAKIELGLAIELQPNDRPNAELFDEAGTIFMYHPEIVPGQSQTENFRQSLTQAVIFFHQALAIQPSYTLAQNHLMAVESVLAKMPPETRPSTATSPSPATAP